MAGPIPLLGLLDELRDFANRRNIGQKLVGGGIKGAAIRGLLGMDAPENATKAEKEVYENAARAAAPVMGLAAAPAAIKTAGRALKDAPRTQALETARQNAVKMLGLPENNTAMDRARAMGFEDGLYHGGTNDFPAFAVSERRNVYATDEPRIGDIYATATGRHSALRDINAGPNVMPLMYRGNLIEVSDQGPTGGGWVTDNLAEAIGSTPSRRIYKEVPSKGFSGVKITNMDDLGGRQTQYVFPEPSVLRSRFAAFDPARINENDLLASLAAMGISIPMILGLLDEERVD